MPFRRGAGFVQSKLNEIVFLRLPQDCGALSGIVVRLGRSLYGLKQASRTWHQHLVRGMKCLGFEQCAADAGVMRLMEKGTITMVVVVDYTVSIGLKSRCGKFGRGLNEYVPISNLGEHRLYAGIRFCRDFAFGTVTLSQQAFAENLVAKFGVTRNRETPVTVGVKLEDFDACEPDVHESFRILVEHLMCLANQTLPHTLNAVQAVARYSHAPTFVHWNTVLHVLMFTRFTTSYGITFQRGTEVGVNLEVYVDSDYASTATDSRSVSGTVVMCPGACVSFSSRTQSKERYTILYGS